MIPAYDPVAIQYRPMAHLDATGCNGRVRALRARCRNVRPIPESSQLSAGSS